MKLFALAITLGLWLGVTGLSTPVTQRITGVRLELPRYSNNTEITNSPIREVDIVVTGNKRNIEKIDKDKIVVSRDITDVPPGDRVISLDPDSVNISLPTGVRLDEIQPNKIAIRLEAVEERDVPVMVQTTGSLPEGYEIYERIVQPQQVRVRGPVSFLRSLDSVSTEPIDLTGHTADFTTRQVPIGVSNAKATVLAPVADVTLRIGERRIERVYSVQVNDGSGRRAGVVLFGPASAFEGLRTEDLSAEVVRSENGQETARLLLPPDIASKIEVRSIRLRQ